jgi:hypothetical protein
MVAASKQTAALPAPVAELVRLLAQVIVEEFVREEETRKATSLEDADRGDEHATHQ